MRGPNFGPAGGCGCGRRNGATGPTGPGGGGPTGSTGPQGDPADVPVDLDIARSAPGGPIDTVQGFLHVPLGTQVVGSTPPVGGAWTYNQVGTNSFKAEKPVMPGHFSLEDYGGVADFDPLNPLAATDNLPAWNAMLLAMRSNGNKTNKIVADGHYFFSGTLDVQQTIVLEGTGQNEPTVGGQRSSPGTWFVFPADTTGMRLRSLSQGPGIGDAFLSIVRNITLSCYVSRGLPPFPNTCATPPGGGSTTGHGIYSNTVFTLEHVTIENFAENGVYVNAGTDIIIDPGNADGFVMYDVRVGGCGGNGVRVLGNDSQAAGLFNIFVTCNWGWGIWDESAGGNTWVACNGEGNLGEPGGFSVDGRNHDYKTGGAIYQTSSCFFGCQTEASNNALFGSSMAIGGPLSTSVDFATGRGFGLSNSGVAGFNSISYKSAISLNGVITEMGDSGEPGISFVHTSFGSWAGAETVFKLQDPSPPAPSTARAGWWAQTDVADRSNGLGDFWRYPSALALGRREMRAPWGPHGVLVGDGAGDSFSACLELATPSATPPTNMDYAINGIPGNFPGRSYETGDRVYDTTPLSGGFIGQVCTVAGTLSVLNGGTTTGDITIATTALTVSSSLELQVNQYITIAGVTGVKKVTDVNYLTNVAAIDSPADATVVGAAVAYSPPTFKTFGPIS